MKKFVIMERITGRSCSFLGENANGRLIWTTLDHAHKYDTREEAEGDIGHAGSNSASDPERQVTISVEEVEV